MLPSLHAAELKALSGNGAHPTVRELCARSEQASGHKVSIHFEVNAALERKIGTGESFDVAVLRAVRQSRTFPQSPSSNRRCSAPKVEPILVRARAVST
jgi:hypothetical protein